MRQVLILSFSFEQEAEGFQILEEGGLHPVLFPESERKGFDEEDLIAYWMALQEKPQGILMGADIKLGRKFVQAAAGLRAISLNCAGMDHLDAEAFLEAGISIQNVPRQNYDAVADFIWGQILSLMRRIPEGDAAIRAGHWCDGVGRGRAVSGRKLGIIGFGAIGQAVAKRARGFDMEVLVSSTGKSADTAKAYGVRYVEREELFRESDILVPACPLAENTRHLINRDTIGQMKKSAVIINAARGGILDTDSLIEAIQQERIAGAALDVFEEEPLMNSKLFEMKHLLLTPHMGGLADREIRKVALCAAHNMVEMLKR